MRSTCSRQPFAAQVQHEAITRVGDVSGPHEHPRGAFGVEANRRVRRARAAVDREFENPRPEVGKATASRQSNEYIPTCSVLFVMRSLPSALVLTDRDGLRNSPLPVSRGGSGAYWSLGLAHGPAGVVRSSNARHRVLNSPER